jgi:hypothetical protein
MCLDIGDDGLGEFDPGMKVDYRCSKPLDEGHVLEDGRSVTGRKVFNVVVELRGSDAEECFRMGALAFGSLVEMGVADIPLCPGRGLE